MNTYCILGGGIAGLTAAIALKQAGIAATVFEAAPAIKPLGAGLLLAANAVKAYEKLGIAGRIVERGRLLPNFSILDERGRVISTVDAMAVRRKYGLHNFAIHRAALHEALLSELAPGQVVTGKRATGASVGANGKVIVSFADGSALTTDYLIVADGIHSAVRRQLLPLSEPRYAGYTCWRAVIDNPGLTLNRASETWGAAGRFGIVPLAGNQIYWFACVNAPVNDPGMQKARVADLQGLFASFHPEVPAILAATRDHQLIWNDIIAIRPIPRFAFGPIVLIGDAAHATTPNLGQGACQAIVDAVVLKAALETHANPVDAFAAFEQRRLGRAQFIVNSSWTMGKIAQIESPWLAALRNAFLRLTPAWANEWQLRRVITEK